MTNDKPASDGGAEPVRLLKQLEASVEASKNFSATVSQLAAAVMEGVNADAKKPERMTVEERYNAERGIKKVPPLKKPSLWFRFRSAVTGLWVSKKYAEANPDTTVRERVD